MQQSELPEGWAWTNYGYVISKMANGTTIKQNKDNRGIPVTRIETISNGVIDSNRFGYVEDIDEKNLEKYSLVDGDVLFSHINSDIHLGKTAIYESKPELLLHGMNLLLLRPNKSVIFPHYLHYLSVFYRVTGEFISVAQHAVNQSSINQKILSSIEIPLPPLPEQHRIVTAIEALFARLDATNERLDRVPGIMKNFRQAVLAAACDGRLTEDWREENPDIESVSLTINKLQSTGRDTKNRANYKVKKMDESNLSDLPRKWEWHSIIEVSNRVTVGHVGPMKDEYVEDGIPFLRSQNVRENRYDPSGLKFISPEFHKKIKKSLLEPNDLVVVRSGNVGVSCVIPDHLKEANCSDLVVVKQPFGFVSKYGSYYLNSIAKSTIDLNKVGIALSHFNTQSVANLPIPLPPLPEQQEIVRRVDALFAFADSIEAKVAVAREKTEKLRQSILAKAFSGELVPTEAELARQEGREYESAEVLLKRIKSEMEGGKK